MRTDQVCLSAATRPQAFVGAAITPTLHRSRAERQLFGHFVEGLDLLNDVVVVTPGDRG